MRIASVTAMLALAVQGVQGDGQSRTLILQSVAGDFVDAMVEIEVVSSTTDHQIPSHSVDGLEQERVEFPLGVGEGQAGLVLVEARDSGGATRVFRSPIPPTGDVHCTLDGAALMVASETLRQLDMKAGTARLHLVGPGGAMECVNGEEGVFSIDCVPPGDYQASLTWAGGRQWFGLRVRIPETNVIISSGWIPQSDLPAGIRDLPLEAVSVRRPGRWPSSIPVVYRSGLCSVLPEEFLLTTRRDIGSRTGVSIPVGFGDASSSERLGIEEVLGAYSLPDANRLVAGWTSRESGSLRGSVWWRNCGSVPLDAVQDIKVANPSDWLLVLLGESACAEWAVSSSGDWDLVAKSEIQFVDLPVQRSPGYEPARCRVFWRGRLLEEYSTAIELARKGVPMVETVPVPGSSQWVVELFFPLTGDMIRYEPSSDGMSVQSTVVSVTLSSLVASQER